MSEARRDLKPFLALEAATVISGTGNGVAALALPWLTLQLTNDPAAAGLVVAVSAVPTLIASLASGLIIDRLGRQRTSVGSDVFSAASAAMIPLLGLAGILTFPLVMVASVIGAVFDPVGVTAREAMLPDVAKRGRLSLERVNGIHEAIWGVAWLIGPGLAGILIATVGAEASFWAMFAGFVVSAVLVGTACLPTPAAHEVSDAHWLADGIEGFRIAWRDDAIRSTSVLNILAFSAAYSVVGVVLPVIFEAADKPREMGWLFAAFSAAGVVGALLYSSVGTRVSRRLLFNLGLWAVVLVPAVFVFSDEYWVQLLALALSGFLTSAMNPINNIVIQERVPEAARGRVLSVVFAFSYVLFPIGYGLSGIAIKQMGVDWTFAAFALACVAVALWGLLSPATRDLGTPEAPHV